MYYFKRPDSGEYAVLAFLAAAVFIGLGIVGLIEGLRASPGTQPSPHELIKLSLWSLSCGVVVVAGCWVARRWNG
jgi:formate/nitrite transporter FocA (FNT family)